MTRDEDEDMVRFLISKGADINIGGSNVKPRAIASVGGRIAMMQLLLYNGANPNLKSGEGPALQAAARARCTEAVEHGADVDVESAAYIGPLLMASGKSHDMARMLLEKGAKLNMLGRFQLPM